MEYIKYVSDEDHLKHIPDYLPVYLLSVGFDNLTKNGKDTIKLYQILKGNGLKDLQYKIYDNKKKIFYMIIIIEMSIMILCIG